VKGLKIKILRFAQNDKSRFPQKRAARDAVGDAGRRGRRPLRYFSVSHDNLHENLCDNLHDNLRNDLRGNFPRPFSSIGLRKCYDKGIISLVKERARKFCVPAKTHFIRISIKISTVCRRERRWSVRRFGSACEVL